MARMPTWWVRPAPGDIAIGVPNRQVQSLLEEPYKGVPCAAEFCDLVEDERNGLLDASVGILLDPIAGFQEANRDSDNKFTTASLLVARGKGALTQEIELILVEAALRS